MTDTARPATAVRLMTVFPILKQLQGYRAEWLQSDLAAGVAVAAVALPIGIAYPEIAGLPPEIGLYASILALIGYAVFGSSRQLIVGPDAATLTKLSASLAQLAIANPGERVAGAAILAVVVGVLCLLSAVSVSASSPISYLVN